MKKYLFLDLDGVINSLEYSVGMENIERDRRFRIDDYDPVKVGLLRFVIRQTGAQVVISSSWRIGRTKDWFVGFFEAVGYPSFPVIDCTPTTVVGRENGVGRGDEIDAWLEHHHPKYRNEDLNIPYAIVDDDGDFYDWQPLVKTSYREGLTLKTVIELIDILGYGDNGDEKRVESLRSHVDFIPEK